MKSFAFSVNVQPTFNLLQQYGIKRNRSTMYAARTLTKKIGHTIKVNVNDFLMTVNKNTP